MKVAYKKWTIISVSLIVVGLVALIFWGGSSLTSMATKVEQPADALLARARVEYDNGKYNTARMLIDSIRIVSPKAYKTLREAEILRREVIIKEKERDVVFLEDELQGLVAVRDSLAAGMVFNKDKRYQDRGYYTAKSQAIAQNAQNNYLRASVYEDGTMFLTSFYRGKNIKHTTVKLSSNGAYASCDKPFLERNYKELGVNNERRDYKYGEDNGLADFILAAQGAVQVELSGGNGKATYTLRESDVDALRSVLELTRAIKAVQMAEDMLGEAQYTLDFLRRCEERSVTASKE